MLPDPRGKLFRILPQTKPNCRVLDLHAMAVEATEGTTDVHIPFPVFRVKQSLCTRLNIEGPLQASISYITQSQENRSQVAKQYLFSHKLYQMNILAILGPHRILSLCPRMQVEPVPAL